ncbi:MAG: tyrosine-type recombinase/integrase [Lachnospiraceae bacterium]|nr:tyrosine-type recombinase/integrase [Lachnospiraceae bacterium]
MPPTAIKHFSNREQQLILGIDKSIEVAGLSNFVFTTLSGTPYAPSNLNNLLRAIVKQYNNQETVQAKEQKREPALLLISCHSFRHTGCTRLAEAHIDIKTLQEFMGHSDIKVTMNVYNHVDSERMTKEVIGAAVKSDVI